jgi:hypothetical protein
MILLPSAKRTEIAGFLRREQVLTGPAPFGHHTLFGEAKPN